MNAAPAFTVEIDCLATARRVLASPNGVFTLTPFEAVALAACTERESTGREPVLPVVPATRDAALFPAPLADRLAVAVGAWDRRAKAQSYRDKLERAGVGECVDAREAFWTADEAFEDAMNLLIHAFEKEFPHGNRD